MELDSGSFSYIDHQRQQETCYASAAARLRCSDDDASRFFQEVAPEKAVNSDRLRARDNSQSPVPSNIMEFSPKVDDRLPEFYQPCATFTIKYFIISYITTPIRYGCINTPICI